MEKSNVQHPCNTQRVYKIGGISVEFPYKAYASQLAFMGKVVATLERSHRDLLNSTPNQPENRSHCHALLESPTGTGKSLSLLCSTLAWLKHFKAVRKSLETQPLNQDLIPVPSHPATAIDRLTGNESSSTQSFLSGSEYVAPESTVIGGGFIPDSAPGEGNNNNGNNQTSKKPKWPKIFYATRTHSQISQVIGEYRKTGYRVSMTILASRKHYCTNSKVCKKKNLEEECKLLLQDPEKSCFQFKNYHKVRKHPSLQRGGCHEIHDIEDFVGVAKSVKGCAYFAATYMAENADIVFCPYVYLLNPTIRSIMEIDLDDSIVILDEAHNIEDVAREAGSLDIETSTLEGMRTELEQLSNQGPNNGPVAEYYPPLLEMVQEMLSWIYSKSNSLAKQDFERYSSCWSGDGVLHELEFAGISLQRFSMLAECARKAVKAAADTDAKKRHLGGFSATTLDSLFSVLNFMLKDNGRHLEDYRVVVQKYVKRDEEHGGASWVSCVSFWCLNPAVVFEDVATKARSIILTSGTLSPLDSFASELGVPFDVCMEAPHVIDMKSQVWAAAIPKGPGNVALNASYKHADGYAFQDALGNTLEELFRVSPDGALVFFPSYKLLDKVCDRWKSTGQWKRLLEEKQLFIEPRGKQETFESILDDYYKALDGIPANSASKGKPANPASKGKPRAIVVKFPKGRAKNAINTQIQSKNGAAFLAVCRGKVSEGINFSDKNARLVVIVGIPFPNQKDLQVNMKKQYNTQNRSSRNLLSGDKWYCYQAFRALNQAVGRCIRHRHDYGAIVLLDERYRRSSNLEYMSKWLRGSIQQLESVSDSIEGLRSFFESFKDTFTASTPLVSTIHSQNYTKSISNLTDPVKQRLVKQKESLKTASANKVSSISAFSSHFVKQKVSQPEEPRFPLQEVGPQAKLPPKLESFEPASLQDNLVSASEYASITKPVRASYSQVTPVASSFTSFMGMDVLNGSSCCQGKTGTESLQEEEEDVNPVTPCNLFGTDDEKDFEFAIGTLSVNMQGAAADCEPLVRSLSPEFLACSEVEGISVQSQYINYTVDSTPNYSSMVGTANQVASISGDNRHAIESTPKQVASRSGDDRHGTEGGSSAILCQRCGGCILKAVRCSDYQKVTLQKKYLCGTGNKYSSQCNISKDILVFETMWMQKQLGSVPKSEDGVWVEEDGCVFKPFFCPQCNLPNRLGAYVVASNRENNDLVDKVLLLRDDIRISIDVFHNSEQVTPDFVTEKRTMEPSSSVLTKRAMTTPFRSKLKLPRRD